MPFLSVYLLHLMMHSVNKNNVFVYLIVDLLYIYFKT